jgi:hypothetical protein
MREGLITLGVILLVLGAIFYFVPTPESAHETDRAVTEGWLRPVALWAMILGAVITILGLLLPDRTAHPEQAITAPSPPEATEEPELTRRERRKIKIRNYRRQP